MITVDLREFYDSLQTCGSIVSDKNAAAVIKVKENTMSVCTADATKRYINKIDIENPEEIERDFILPLGKTLEIMVNYLPGDGIDAEFSFEISEDNVFSTNCVHMFSPDKYDDEMAGRTVASLSNRIVAEAMDNPRRAMIAKSRYDELLEEVDDVDEWNCGELKDKLNKLMIDKQTRNIYISAKQSKMYAIGKNQVSMFDIGEINHGFILDVSVAKAVVNALAKFNGDTVLVSAADSGKYITISDEDGNCALWVCGAPANRGDMKKIGIYTNEELTYDDYRGACSRVALNTIINSILSSDKADSQRIEIINTDNPENAELKLSNVAVGGSVENKFSTMIFQFRKGANAGGDLSGAIGCKTLKDILSVCTQDYVGIQIQKLEQYIIIKIEDKYADGNGEVVNLSQHYTLIQPQGDVK